MTRAPARREAAGLDEIVLRDLRVTDLPALEWDGEYRHFRRVFRHAFDETLSGRRIMLGAFDGGLLVGQVFVQLFSSDTCFADGCERGYLYSLRVRAEYQRRGIGTRLIEEAEARLRAKGFKTAVIAAGQDNPGARALYERLGYRVFMQDPGEWSFLDADGKQHRVEEPCWVMEKSL